MSSTAPSIAVCICTFRREPTLTALLQAIGRLELAGLDAERIRIVLVDNDHAGSAEHVARRLGDSLPCAIRYRIEPRRGIPFARNTAVREAGPVDFIAFIDDDEVPEPQWLAELVRVQRLSGAAIVTGPVLPLLPTPAPRWARAGGFYERPRHRTGERLDYARTSNVLIAARVFGGHAEPFSPRFVLGGEDTHFFMRAHRESHAIVWADGARVHESVSGDRVRLGWLLRRAYRRGVILSQCLQEFAWSPPRILKRAVHGLVRVAHGGVLVLGAVSGGPVAAIRGLREIAFGFGLLHGLLQDHQPTPGGR
jgi:glycosyltransferase involved in cell wall biosynthesis